MATASTRSQALALFRSVLRAARTWPQAHEREYIRNTAREEFRSMAACRDRSLILQALEEGEQRLGQALHYGITNPRINHYIGGGGEGQVNYRQHVVIAPGPRRVNVGGAARWKA